MTIRPLALFALPARSAGTRSSGERPEAQGDPTDSVDMRLKTVELSKPANAPVLKHGFPVEGFCWTPDGKLLSTESPNLVGTPAKIRLWDPQGGEPTSFDVSRPNVRIGPVASSPDGELVAVGWEDGKFSIYSGRGVELNHQTHCPTSVPNEQGILIDRDDVRAVTFSPDRQTLATGGQDGRVQLWDPQGNEKRGTLEHPDWVTEIAFTPDSSRIVTRFRGGVAIWDAQEKRPLHMLYDTSKIGTGGFALSPDGTRVAAVFEKAVKVFDVESGEELHSRSIWGGSKIAFTPDGNHLLVGEAIRNAVHDWNLATGECHRQELPHERGAIEATGIRQITLSGDGQQLAVSMMDYSLTLWNRDAQSSELGYIADNLRKPEGGTVARLGDFVYAGGVRVPARR